VPLKRARPDALPDGSADGLPAAYLTSGGRDPAASHHGGTECSAQPPFAISIASHPFAPASPPPDSGAVHLERLLRRHLEELRFTFGDEPLADLEGFLICEDGNRALITAGDLDPYARIFLYLHCLGHLALGHVDGARLSVTYEFRDRWRLPPHEQAREAAADAWALQLLSALSSPTTANCSPQAIRQQLGALHLPPGFLRACLQRLRAALAVDPAVGLLLRHYALQRL
jgi:hypothetical protein